MDQPRAVRPDAHTLGALLAATRAVVGHADDLTAACEAVADAARQLLGADAASVHLIGRGDRAAARRGELVVPLVEEARCVGTLVAGWTAGAVPPGAVEAAEAFAGWAAAAIGAALRVEAERAGRARHDQAHGRLRGIIQAAAGSQLAADEDGVFEALGRAARGAGVSLHVTTLNPTASELTVRHVSVVGVHAGWLRSLLGRPPVGIRIAVDDVPQYRAVVREARPVFAEDAVDWLRAAVPWLPGPAQQALIAGLKVKQAMAAPMIDGGRVLGVLSVWGPTLGPLELPTLELLGRVAGASLHGLRLRQREQEGRAEAERARAEIEAIFDASDDPVLLFAPNGRLLRANRAGEAGLVGIGVAPPCSLDEMLRAARARGFELDEPDSVAARVLRGEQVDQVCRFRGSEWGAAQWLHVRGLPVIGQDGRPIGAVVSARDVTHLHADATDRALLHGAVATARRVAHELNDQLQLLTSYAELLPTMGTEDAREAVSRIADAAQAAGQVVHRLQRIVRFRETRLGGGPPALDLEAATGPER